MLEELGWGDAPLAAAALTPALFVQPILDFGTDEQKQELPAALHRRRSSTPRRWRCSSRASAFDAGSLRTVAEPKGTGFSLTG